MTISEKVAYLKGLAEGLDIDTEKSKEGKLISVMIGILEEVGLSIEDLEENTVALGEEIDALSDDLSDVEQLVFEDEDVILISEDGVIIRIPVGEIRQCARPSKGVRVMKVPEGSRVVTLASAPKEEAAEDPEESAEEIEETEARDLPSKPEEEEEI